MSSLRKRLFLILVAATVFIWLSAVAWIYVGTQAHLEHMLDARLQEAARMVTSLVSGDKLSAENGVATIPAPDAGYERQLSCQIWSLDGRLVARSSGAPGEQLAEDGTGFSEQEIGGQLWRVFTIEDAKKGVRVMVGDRLSLRDRLVTDLMLAVVMPALLIVPLLGLLI